MPNPNQAPYIAIACGGTGGHVFPGLAVGEALARQGAEITLIVSPKAVDREALAGLPQVPRITMEAVGWEPRRPWRFVRGVFRSWTSARRAFRHRRPDAVLAMGGFTSVGPVLEAKRLGVRTYLHESNTIPGRANRWLAHWVDQAFVGFPEASRNLRARRVQTTGTPVRFGRLDKAREDCCRSLGLDSACLILLVTGGSQGASRVNQLVRESLRGLRSELPELQFIHLTGPREVEEVRAAYRDEGLGDKAIVRGFCDDMVTLLGAADLAVGRAGASTLAEFAAMEVPAVLIPYPTAADNHQWFNARAFSDAGAAVMLEQAGVTAEILVRELVRMACEAGLREAMRKAMAKRHEPGAAVAIASCILGALSCSTGGLPESPTDAASQERGRYRSDSGSAQVPLVSVTMDRRSPTREEVYGLRT